jgi:hypothetical protein
MRQREPDSIEGTNGRESDMRLRESSLMDCHAAWLGANQSFAGH